jgi:hypothetical protein
MGHALGMHHNNRLRGVKQGYAGPNCRNRKPARFEVSDYHGERRTPVAAKSFEMHPDHSVVPRAE